MQDSGVGETVEQILSPRILKTLKRANRKLQQIKEKSSEKLEKEKVMIISLTQLAHVVCMGDVASHYDLRFLQLFHISSKAGSLLNAYIIKKP